MRLSFHIFMREKLFRTEVMHVHLIANIRLYTYCTVCGTAQCMLQCMVLRSVAYTVRVRYLIVPGILYSMIPFTVQAIPYSLYYVLTRTAHT